MQRNLILALHGFLGQGCDWDQVKNELQDLNSGQAQECQWITPNLLGPRENWVQPYEPFCKALVEKYNSQLQSSQKKIFIGYSLGGRLGLHLLTNYADQFEQFIFVSTHPGLRAEAEKKLRKENDINWSLKITPEKWFAFLNEWNAQGVLKSMANEPLRQLQDFNLKALQTSLETWSLGEQQDFRAVIQKHQQKITWAVGTEDSKFLNLAEDLEQKKILLSVSRISSGHRILLENPKQLALILLHQLS